MTTLRAVWTRSAGAAERPSHWAKCGGLLFRETGETGDGKTIRLQAAGILSGKAPYTVQERKICSILIAGSTFKMSKDDQQNEEVKRNHAEGIFLS